VAPAWVLTEDVEEFLAAAGDFLRSQRVRNTVLLTSSETLRVQGPEMYGPVPPLFGWWCDGDEVTGAFLESPPYPMLLSHLPREALEPLADALVGRERRVAGVNSVAGDTEVFATAWQDRTGATVVPHWRQRLFRLAGLVAPDPSPAGHAVIARAEHRELLIQWCAAFSEEIGEPARNIDRLVDDRLEYGGLTVWEVDRLPVAIAGRTRKVAEMARVGPVYTPPDQRGQGFGSAVTAAVSQSALDAGAEEVLLFADLANPTSNRIYQRLGYRGVEDRVVLLFGA
jgi:predicted GNAT family acetyltransferase